MRPMDFLNTPSSQAGLLTTFPIHSVRESILDSLRDMDRRYLYFVNRGIYRHRIEEMDRFMAYLMASCADKNTLNSRARWLMHYGRLIVERSKDQDIVSPTSDRDVAVVLELKSTLADLIQVLSDYHIGRAMFRGDLPTIPRLITQLTETIDTNLERYSLKGAMRLGHRIRFLTRSVLKACQDDLGTAVITQMIIHQLRAIDTRAHTLGTPDGRLELTY